MTNIAIEAKMIMLGISLFMLYKGQEVVRDKNYLSNLWRQKVQHTFDVLEITSIFVMLTVAIVTNTEIPQVIFIPLLITFSVISFFSEAYISLNRYEYFEKHREYNNEQSVIVNDLLRVPAIVENDLLMRISKYQKSVIESNQNIKKFHTKRNWSNFVSTLLETLSQYGVIIIFLVGVQWDEISLATITEITATLVIVEKAIGYIRDITYTLNGYNECIIIIEKEKRDMIAILEVYHQEEEKLTRVKQFIQFKSDLVTFSIWRNLRMISHLNLCLKVIFALTRVKL